MGSDREDHFTSPSIHNGRFPTFSLSQELSVSFLFATYDDFLAFLTRFPHLGLPRLP